MNFENNSEKIKKLISNKSLLELKKFFEEYSILADDYNNFNEILIYAIENNTSLEIVEYIIHIRADKNLNFSIVIDDKIKIPLFEAVKNNNFDIANILIKNKADINYETDTIHNKKIFKYLYYNKFLTIRNLNYILSKGFTITTHDLHSLVENGDGQFLEIVCSYTKYDSRFILDLMNSSRHQIPISNDSLNEKLKKEKGKLKIDEYMYRKADEKEFNDVLRILFKNDDCSKNILYRRIIKYNLLEKSIESEDRDYIEKLLNIKPFNYKCMNYNKILIKVIEGLKNSNNDRKRISKLFIDSFIYDSNNICNNSNDTLTNITYDQQYFNLILNISIKNHNMEAIKYLMEDEEYKINLDINIKDINSEYPLINALYQEQNEILKYLIEHGGDCNIKNNHGIPLLVLAIQKNNPEIVKYILEKPGIHINEKCPNGYSAFMSAVNQNNTDFVELIINYSNDNSIPININEKDASGNYPITKAINKNNFDMVILLMEYGIDNKINMNLTDINGYSLLYLAYKQKHLRMFKYLTEYLNINRVDNTGQSILFIAVDENDIDTVEYLIHCGANLNIHDKYNNSVIDYVIFNGNIKMLNLLLENDNLLLNEYNSEGETPLISLIKSNKFTSLQKEKIIINFINKGCFIEKPDKKDKLPPLIHAIRNNKLSITKLLIRYGVNINKKNSTGYSYVRYGVNYTMGDYEDFYSNEITKYLFGTELYNIIEDEYLFSSEINNNDINHIKRLLPTILNINKKNILDGNTLLHEAVLCQKPEVVKLLLEKGINKSIKNNNGKDAKDLNESKNKPKYSIYNEIRELLN